MAFNYSKSQATAARLIAKFGQSAIIRRMVNSGDPWNPVQTVTDYSCTIVELEYTAQEIDGTLIAASDKKVYISTGGLTITPAASDNLVYGGVSYSIASIKPLSPAGTVVYYEVQARA